MLIMILAGCQFLPPLFEKPSVSLKSFRVAPSRSLNPEFVIDLHVTNPNNFALSMAGLSYEASIEGHRLLSGVANDLPVVEAYGETDIAVRASPDMFGSLRLLQDLMQKRRDALKFALKIKVDPGKPLPPIYLSEEGEISLTPTR